MKYPPQFIINNDVRHSTLIITKVNEVYMKIESEAVIRQELVDFFSFAVPGAKFMPAFKNRMWDGKVRLFDGNTKQLYLGLLPYVEHFASEREYTIEASEEIHSQENYSLDEGKKFIEKLQLKLTPRDYQIDSFVYCIRNNRSVIVSPTASGKSLIIYLLVQYYQKKTLLIVPTVSLVHQMRSDFIDYGMHEDDIHIIMGGEEKRSDVPIIISTWQSIYKMRKDYFAQFDIVIGDECH